MVGSSSACVPVSVLAGSGVRSRSERGKQVMPNISTLTVKELKTLLENFDDDSPVYFGYNYGDHWRTEVADAITKARLKNVRYSDYHSMMRVVDESEESSDRPEEGDKEIVLLT